MAKQRNGIHPIDSAMMKLDWAKFHLQNLDRSKSEYQQEMQRRSPAFVSPPLATWALIVGDAVHNMRCALDHIAYGLAVENRRPAKPSGKPTFPLLQHKNPKLREALADIAPAAIDVIERFQPYERRNQLWMLSVLDNADKHHQISVYPTRHRIDLQIESSASQPAYFSLFTGRRLEPDPEKPGDLREVTGPVASATIDVLIGLPGDPPAEITENELHRINDYVRNEVVPAFMQFFPRVPG